MLTQRSIRNAAALLAKLHDLGVAVSVDGNIIRVAGPEPLAAAARREIGRKYLNILFVLRECERREAATREIIEKALTSLATKGR